jgi:hypothetical protein
MHVQDDRRDDSHTGEPLQPLEPERTRRVIALFAVLLLLPALAIGIWLALRAGSDAPARDAGAVPERIRPGEIERGSIHSEWLTYQRG